MGGAAPNAAAARNATDAEAVERARRGDHAAFRVLVERYQARAYRLALRVLRDDEQARDVVQDALLKAYGSLDRFEGRSSFYTWLYRIVMNLCLDRKRRSRSDREVEWSDDTASTPEPGAAALAPDASGGDPEEQLSRRELGKLVARAIEELPEDARRTLELREVDGLSYKEIAEALGIPKGTVMSRLYYARRRLQEALEGSGVEDFLGRGAEGTA